MRSTKLDELARTVAAATAAQGLQRKNKHHIREATDLKVEGSVLKGKDIRGIHKGIMTRKCKARNRILNTAFQQFGIGTCKAKNGSLIVVQVFSRTGRFEI